MIPKECKRLAEVDFPIAVVGKHSLSEKARRTGTPHQLHLWWAWRPLAACRAMLLALLLPDPCDEHCPADFKEKARQLLTKTEPAIGPNDKDLRKVILDFIGDFSDWDNSSNLKYVAVGRGLVQAAYPEETPLVVDPFAGGGSIPLEALRLDCDAFASELNPVASLILKAKLVDIPRQNREFANELLQIGGRINESVANELAEFYPSDADGAKPIAYLWARTVRCETPNCGAEIPLVRSFWLCKKANRRRALRYRASCLEGKVQEIEFEIFEPTTTNDVPNGTVIRAKAECPFCETVLSRERVCAQFAEQRGGANVVFDGDGNRVGGARLIAVVMLKPGETGRHYRLQTQRDYEAVWKAQQRLVKITSDKLADSPNTIPDEPLPPIGTLGFRVQRYGMLQWGDLFTKRQMLSLLYIAGHIEMNKVASNRELLALSLSKLAERNNTICDWMVDVECPGHLYT